MPSHAERLLASKRCESASQLNLVALNGGKFLLEDDSDWQALRKAVARDQFEGNRNFLVEHKTPVFRLFFDIDFAHATLGMDYVTGTLLPGILEGVGAAIDKHVLYQDVIVAASPPKAKGELTKTGVHLHWFRVAVRDVSTEHHLVELAVDSETAMAIRASVLHALKKLPDVGLNLEDVVDERVLKQNGIRMLYSQKCAPCDRCQAAKRDASKQSPCECSPKSASFWRCGCTGCARAKALCKGAQREHGGCHLGRVYSNSCYTPLHLIRWEGGRVTKQHCMRGTDPLRALELCSPRFPTSAPFPTVAPVGTDWLDVQDEVRTLIGDAMQQNGFKLPGEAGVVPPQLATIKAMDSGILAAGRFFCKATGDYHTSSTSFFMLWSDGRLSQKCHNTGCGGKRYDCGVWPLPKATAALMKSMAKGKGKQA
ncbi:hypothetical protein WJX74_005572 [Apatococcus lobatus]|uniref:C962R-like N-terminal AEP domain-containing protein n=1 Tax=Apatococcus lobatus TaxID=904363 RepID=A0AAW1Q706_9CHLO